MRCVSAFISCSAAIARVLPLRGLCLRDATVGFRLRHLQFGPDVLADIDVRDIDRHNLKRGSGIEPFGEHRFADAIRILQDFLVVDRRADR